MTCSKAIGGALAATLGLLYALCALSARDASILIQSAESRTIEQGPVFNRIRLISEADRDVWLMQQSHHGLGAGPARWDRLAIVVDKTRTPKVARFLQLTPGPLELPRDLEAERRPYRISCFFCHSNGPRAIRPESVSPRVSPTLAERATLLAWNLRIKAYGRVRHAEVHDREDATLAVPFRARGAVENEPLTVKACARCHGEEGFPGRGVLTRQNALTIRFMVSSGAMPPPGFSLDERDRRAVQAFVDGF